MGPVFSHGEFKNVGFSFLEQAISSHAEMAYLLVLAMAPSHIS